MGMGLKPPPDPGIRKKPACQIIEIIGSGDGLEDAVRDAMNKAKKSGYEVHSVDIKGFTVKVGDRPWRADCKLAVD